MCSCHNGRASLCLNTQSNFVCTSQRAIHIQVVFSLQVLICSCRDTAALGEYFRCGFVHTDCFYSWQTKILCNSVDFLMRHKLGTPLSYSVSCSCVSSYHLVEHEEIKKYVVLMLYVYFEFALFNHKDILSIISINITSE